MNIWTSLDDRTEVLLVPGGMVLRTGGYNDSFTSVYVPGNEEELFNFVRTRRDLYLKKSEALREQTNKRLQTELDKELKVRMEKMGTANEKFGKSVFKSLWR